MRAASLIAWIVVYALGVARVWHSAGRGRGVTYREAAAFAGGWLTLVAALLSPVDDLSETWLAMHMVQHELLMVVAAPLIALSAPLVAMLWALPARWRRSTAAGIRDSRVPALWAVVTAPGVAWLLHAGALWLWHLPRLYDYAARHEGAHLVQHLCFFVSAALFWWGLMRGRYGRVGYGAAVVYLFATAIHSGLLGAGLTFSPRVWFSTYAAPHGTGLSPLEDQQLAGLLMWIPAGLILVAGGLCFFVAWLRESERRVGRLAGTPIT
jgi:putative membrane protein